MQIICNTYTSKRCVSHLIIHIDKPPSSYNWLNAVQIMCIGQKKMRGHQTRTHMHTRTAVVVIYEFRPGVTLKKWIELFIKSLIT